MKMLSLSEELKGNSYPGRGIVIGRSEDGTKAVTAYFIMGRSVNSRNRVFVTEGEGIRTDRTLLRSNGGKLYRKLRAPRKEDQLVTQTNRR